MIIDFHAHAFPDPVAVKVIDQLAGHYGHPPAADGTLAGLLAAQRQAGVDLTVVHTAATRPAQVRAANDWAIQLAELDRTVQDPPAPRLLPFGTLHPGYSDVPGELARLRAAGLRGLKFHPDFQGFYLDSPEALALFASIGPEFVILIHVGDLRSLGRPDYSSPARLRRLVQAVPGLKVVAAHLGGYRMWDELGEVFPLASVYVDSSSSLALLDRDEAVRLIRAYGAERVLFGSDFPLWSAQDELRRFAALPLTETERDLILWRNSARLLQLDG
ncbi:MAG: amidohydrolase family protein [Chitinophagales bacterium]